MSLHVRRSTVAVATLALAVAYAEEGSTSHGLRESSGVSAQRAVVQQTRLPERYTDAEFWRMITELSEPDGSFHSENFVSNEGTFQRIIPALSNRVSEGGVYLGVGPEQNFSYIAALRPRIAFIVDIRRQNMIQHLMYKAIFERSPTRADFLSNLFSRPKPAHVADNAPLREIFEPFLAAPANAALFETNLQTTVRSLVREHNFALAPEDSAALRHVYHAFFSMGPAIRYMTPLDGAGGGRYVTMIDMLLAPDDSGVNRSFLANEQSYKVVRDMHRSNRIVPLVADFSGPKTLRALGEYLRANEARLSAFYVSNVESYLFRERGAPDRFYQNVESMPRDSTAVFIRPPSGMLPQALGSYRAPPPAGDSMVIKLDSGGVIVYRSMGGQRGFYELRLSRTSVSELPPFASIDETLAAFREGQITRYGDVFKIGR